jgi:hypothetical protein
VFWSSLASLGKIITPTPEFEILPVHLTKYCRRILQHLDMIEEIGGWMEDQIALP